MPALYKHYLAQQEIQKLESEDQHRKSLIKLAVLKILYLSKTKGTKSATDDLENPSISRINELTKKNHEYEVAINKLKQLYTTKEKLQESKLESLREELGKLKQQLKEQPNTNIQVPALSTFQPKLDPSLGRPASSFSTSPYVNKIMFNQASDRLSKNYSSPTINSINKSIFASDLKSGILSPIQHKKKVLVPTKAKREYTNYNSMKKQFEQNSQLSQAEQNTEPDTPSRRMTRSASKTASSALLTPTRTSPSASNLSGTHQPPASTSATPTKAINNGKLFEDKLRSLDDVINKSLTSDAENDNPDANSTTLESAVSRDNSRSGIAENDSFASANSSLAKQSGKKDRKKKKLKLWKSEVSKISASPSDKKEKAHSKGFHLEDEGLNTLNYYQDENFLNENETPKATRKRRIDEETESTPLTFKKKKKNVFRVD